MENFEKNKNIENKPDKKKKYEKMSDKEMMEQIFRYLKGDREARDIFYELIRRKDERIGQLDKKVSRLETELKNEKAGEDGLTKLGNRRRFYNATEEQVDNYLNNKEMENKIDFYRPGGDEFTGFISSEDNDVAVIMGDLAYLNRINEIGGHAGGDMALKEIADILRRTKDRVIFKGEIGDIAQKTIDAINNASEKIELPPLYEGLELSLNMGYASVKEAVEVYDELGLNSEGKEKYNKIADLMVKVADVRAEIAKARDRVWELCRKAEPVLEIYKIENEINNKRMRIDYLIGQNGATMEDLVALKNEKNKLSEEKDRKTEEKKSAIREFYEALKFSLKGIAGLRGDELLQIAEVSDPRERFEKIKERIEANLELRSQEEDKNTEEEMKLVKKKAKEIPPILKHVINRLC